MSKLFKVALLCSQLIYFNGIVQAQTPTDLPVVIGSTIICYGQSTTLIATGTGPAFSWYDAETGGNLLFDNDTIITPILTQNTTYWVSDNGGTRKKVNITVVGPPYNLLALEDTITSGGSTYIKAETGSGQINWYTSPTGSSVLMTSLSGQYKKVTPSSSTTYYAQAQSLPVNVTFNYTGDVQTFTVPSGVTSISIEAYGAKGRAGSPWGTASDGGNGGKVLSTMNVTPGQVLYIYVGGVGGQSNTGYNGGGGWPLLQYWYGSFYGFGGCGGGATDIRIGGQDLTNRVLVAGGGGGGGSYQCPGGAGGGLVGGAGGGPYNGAGGTQAAGGAGGCGSVSCGQNGASGTGGYNAFWTSTTYSGSGGGGWYGGGGGGINFDQNTGGGGGGSSYTNPVYCSNVVHTQGVNGGHGSLKITYLESCTSVRVPITITVDGLSHPTVPAQPANPTYTGTTTICTVNSTTITAQGAQGATFSWWDAPTAGTLIKTGATYTTPSFSTAGVHNYYVEQTSGGYTSNRTAVVVTVNQTPVVTASASPSALCIGTSSTLSASGADTYLWNPGGLTGAPSVTPSLTTTYTVIGTTNGCASAPVTTTVNVQSISDIANVSICRGSSATLSTSGADSYVWQPGSLTGSSVSVSPTTTTTYTVTGTHSAFGCTTTKNVTVTVNPVPVLTLMADTTITAGSQALLTASASVTSTFNWTSSFSNNPVLTGASVVVVPTSTTTYTVTGSTPEGCSFASDQVTVTVIPVAAISGNLLVCEGSTTTLTATGTGPFTWYNAASGGSLLYTGAAFTTPAVTSNVSYWVSANGGPRKEVMVNMTPDPSNVGAASGIICYNDTTYLRNNLVSGTTYWYTGSIGGTLIDSTAYNDSLLVSPLVTTTYYAQMVSEAVDTTYYLTGGEQTFTVPAGVTSIDIEALGACGRAGSPWGTASAGGYGGKVQATMNVTPGQVLYIYVGGVGGQSTAGYNGGGGWPLLQYWYSYYLGFGGCGGGATDIRSGGHTLYDRVLVAGGGGGGGSYFGQGGVGGGLIGGSGAGQSVGAGGTQTSGGQAGCGISCSQNGTFGVGGYNTFWTSTKYGGSGGGGWYGGGGGSITFESNSGGGGGGSSYTHPALFSNVVHTQGVNGGHGSLKIAYYKSCTFNSDPITITVNSCLPTVTTQTVSNISTATAIGNGTVTDLGGPNPTQHGVCWNTSPNPTIANSKTEEGGVSATGSFTSYITGLTSEVTYYVRAYATNNAGTAYGEEVVFTTAGINDIPDDPTHTGTTSLCSGHNTVLTAHGETGATFSWWDAPVAGHLIQIGGIYTTPVFNTGGTYHYYVDQTVGGFTSTRTHIEVTVTQTPVVTAQATPSIICYGASSNLSASGATTYLWNPGGLTGAPTVSPTVTTTYTVTGTTGGCTSAPVNVTVAVDNISNIPDVTICSGNSTTLSTSGADSYIWQPGGLTGSSVSVSPSSTTTYTVTGTHTVSGCQSVKSVTVTVNPTPPAPTIPANYSVSAGTQVSITASSAGATNYYWSTNFSNYGSLTGSTISYVPTSSTTFSVYGVSDQNCPSATSQLTVTVLSIPEVSGPTTVCSGQTSTLTASGTGPFTWYDAATGGNLLYEGEIFTKPALTENTSYWVSGNGGPRKEIKINITPPPGNASSTSNILCKGTSAYLKTSLSTGFTYWYKDSITGAFIDSVSPGDSLLVTLDTTTTYYAVMQSSTLDTTFNYTGGMQTFTVPAGVSSIDIEAYGAKGRDGSPWGGNGPGGYGGKIQTSMNVTPGQVLNIYVGGAGGYNGGGSSYSYYWYGSYLGFGGNGGGATDIRIGGQALTDRVVVAGGGGGGSDYWPNVGGAGGGLTGGAGSGNGPGAGGSQTAGGQAGCPWYCGGSGTLGNGGTLGFGSAWSSRYGGSGGGGWFGGGGGGAHYSNVGGSGGGGSSYTNAGLCSNVIHTQGVNNGNGYLKITYFNSCTTNSPVTLYVSDCYPSVITQSPTNISGTTATFNGTITDLGTPGTTQHGFCWSTSSGATIANDKTEEGTPSQTGPFTSQITGLALNTTYYIRAYAINYSGIVYGNEIIHTTPYFNGGGNEVDPYQIANLTDLRYLSEHSNYWNKFFIQTADIDAKSTIDWNGQTGFSPIGTMYLYPYNTPFTGNYNGQGFAIDSLYINRSNYDGYYQGVFGYTSGATIKNLGVTGAHISGTSGVGCISGRAQYTTISSCYGTGIVSGTTEAAGLVGSAYQSSISRSYSAVDVTGTSYFIGGLVGYNNSSTISDCYSRSNISGSGNYVGGLTGNNTSYIYRSYSTGTVAGSSNVGGFSGSEGGGNGHFVSCYWDIQASTIPTSAGGTGKTTVDMTTKTNFTNAGWDFKGETAYGNNDIWNIGNGRNDGYPYFDWEYPADTFYLPCELTTTTVSNIASDTANSGGVITNDGGYSITARGVCWSTSQNPTIADSHTGDGSGTGTFNSVLTGLEINTTYYVRAYATNAISTFYGAQVSFTTHLFENGMGTAQYPFEIATLNDLRILSENSSLWNKYFVQTADIDASPTSGWNSGTGFSPIGTYYLSPSVTFTGQYNGQGHVINGIYMNRTGTDGYYHGVFGYISGAVISNLGVINANISGTTGSGCIAGSARGNTTISNCYSSGTVNGTQSVGGLVGTLYQSSVSKSYSVATVTGSSYFVGGLVGDNNSSTVSDCYCRGNVSSTGDYVGGLVGRNLTNIYRSYSTGTVTGSSSTGGLVGSNSGNCSNSFWDTQTSSMPTSSGGTGKTTSEMNALSTFYQAGWDFKGETNNGTNDIWNIGNSRNDGYPYFDWEFPGDTTLTMPVVTTDDVSNITTVSATSGGNVISEGGSTVTAKGICWNTSPNPTIANSYTTNGSGTGVYVSSITGLQPAVTYYVRAYASNFFGTIYGEEKSFTTPSLIPTVTTQAVTGITASGATGNGNITVLGGPHPTQYGICWSTSPNPTTANSKTEEGAASATGPFTSDITDLAPNTTYYVRAYAVNTVGTAYGDELSFTTLSNILIVSTQAVTGITESSATGNGTMVNLGLPAPYQHGVCWSTTANPTINDYKTEEGVPSLGAFTSAITGLTVYTTYYVRAYALSATDTVYGDEVSFTTLPVAPVVTTQAVTDIAAGKATGNGNITTLGVPAPSQHGLCWNTSANPTISNSKSQNGPASSTGAFTSELSGLSPQTTYYVRAYATNAMGTVYGDQVSFTTTALNGDGTSGNPYQITCLDDLRIVSQSSTYWNKYLIQTTDIDASATSGWNSGSGLITIGNSSVKFTGNYNGQSHTINNLYINRGNYTGLFGYTNGATIQNVGVVNCAISGGEATGGLIGQATTSTINKCFSTGSITATGWSSGGLIGLTASSTTVNNSYSRCSVNGYNGVGGLVGNLTGSSVNKCFSTGSVNGSGSSYFGGLIGLMGTATNSFWDKETSGRTTSAGGATGKTTSEMKTKTTYTNAGWDFNYESTNGTDNIWCMNDNDNNGYPFLNWQGYFCPNPQAWTGTTNSDWNTASNWNTSLVPDSNSIITIPAGTDISISGTTDAEVFDLEITPNSSLTINDNGSLSVKGDIKILSDVDGTGSFIDNGTLQVDGESVVQKYLAAANVYGWTVATPVVNAPQAVFDGDINTFYYNPLLPGWEAYATGNMQLMKGYWTKFNSNQTLEFNDVLNTDTITFTNFYRTALASGNFGWNFIGNPYPSFISWSLVEGLTINNQINNNYVETTKLNKAVYISNNNGGYLSYVNGIGQTGFADGLIPPATAFWVQVNSAYVNASGPVAGASLSFNNTVRVHQNTGAKKTLPENILRLFLKNQQLADDAILRPVTYATTGFDETSDAQKMMAENESLPQLYFISGGDKMSINCIPEITEPTALPLGVVLPAGSPSCIASELSAFDENTSVYLEDLYTNTMTDMRKVPEYQFSLTGTEDNNRFVLHLAPMASPAESGLTETQDMTIYTYGNTLYINTSDNKAVMVLYDILGQEVLRKVFSSAGLHKVSLTLAKGQYVVSIVSEGSILNKKVYLR